MSFDEGFEAPTGRPQMEVEELSTIRELLFDISTPKWNQTLAAELAHFCRASVAVRSAILFALEIGRVAELTLRKADTMDEVRKAQGACEATEKYVETLLIDMEIVENRSEEDEPEEQ